VSNRLRLLGGLAAIFFYAVRAGFYLARGEPHNLLWSCHVACLLVGLGWLLASRTLNAIGFLWAAIGLPLWLVDLTTGGEFVAASLLTHVGGLALGGFGVRALGLPRAAWWQASLALAAMLGLTRALAPPASNVNLAFGVWKGWEAWFPSHALYLLLLGAASTALFFSMSRVLRASVP
jgi:hypothetical protein